MSEYVMFKYINQITVFIIELIMIGSFAYFGFQKGTTPLVKYTLAITLPLLAILAWSYFAAPKSGHRLPMPYLALFRLTLFLAASYYLYATNKGSAALVLALLSVATQIVGYFLDD